MATIAAKLLTNFKCKHELTLKLIGSCRSLANEIKLNEREQYDILPYEAIPDIQRLPHNSNIAQDVFAGGGASK